jgi:hypothetical protein
MTPQFPEFKPIELVDYDLIQEHLWNYHPETSELNFTNFFMWRQYYGFQWSTYQDWLLILATSKEEGFTFFPPIGPQGRREVCEAVLAWLQEEKHEKDPRIVRADNRLANELKGVNGLTVEATENHFDYVYRSEDLIQLAGRKYHSKRNHINKFNRLYQSDYAPIDNRLVYDCLAFYQKWCDWHKCNEEPVLKAECEAIHEILLNMETLQLKGGAIIIDKEVYGFALGEMMNEDTAVIHIEKADPEIPQLYTVINQQFCEHTWQDVAFINREQDLGKPGLRKAKQSYYPHRLVEKYVIRPYRKIVTVGA